MSDLSCAKMRELAPELALDVLTGYERATAQAHLNECAGCRAYVGSLTQISDRLLTLVPPAEPPVGFEDRVLSRMGMAAKPVRQPRRRWFPIAAVAAVAALVFGVGGWVIGGIAMSTTTTAEQSEFRFAALHTSDNRQVGQVFAYQGIPPWMYMSVATDPSVTSVACQLVRKDGSTVPAGRFQLSAGKGSWGAEITVDPATVVGARLVSTGGKVLATATFSADEQGGWHPR
ncbi:MAG TPA: hypothetical protein VHF06_29295 [Pseudonocardiaceae bacterium]|jgi:hypothetical protein|nr:hypothetical protein [Pseudonocardiaceae bacterium]